MSDNSSKGISRQVFLTFSLAWMKVSRTKEVLSCEAIDDTASGLFFGKVVGM